MADVALEAFITCGIDQAEGLCLAAFANSPDAPEQYLMLQRAVQEDEQDRRLGLDTYYVEWCDQGWSSHGGIEAFFLGRSSAQVVFNSVGTLRLGGLEQLSLSFRVSDDEWQTLHGVLAAIFRGTGRLAVADA